MVSTHIIRIIPILITLNSNSNSNDSTNSGIVGTDPRHRCVDPRGPTNIAIRRSALAGVIWVLRRPKIISASVLLLLLLYSLNPIPVKVTASCNLAMTLFPTVIYRLYSHPYYIYKVTHVPNAICIRTHPEYCVCRGSNNKCVGAAYPCRR